MLTVPTLLRLNREEVRARVDRRNNLRHPDYIQHLLPPAADEKQELPDEEWLLAQANVLIVAGFDPITNLLSAVVYYLGKCPDKMKRLVQEIREAFSSYDDINPDALQKLNYLQAVLDEGLRIHTNAAFGLPRLSPGANVDGHFIPKGVCRNTEAFASFANEEFRPPRKPATLLPRTTHVTFTFRESSTLSDSCQRTIHSTTRALRMITKKPLHRSHWDPVVAPE